MSHARSSSCSSATSSKAMKSSNHFDLLPVQARGFTPAGYRQGQLELVWRSRFGHETPDLLALSFNPFSGTVRAFGQARRPTMPSADFCTAVRSPYDVLSPER